MSDRVDTLAIYLHLAQASLQRRRPMVRDRLLTIAAAAAVQCELPLIAAYCRHEILKHNPHHAIGGWATVEEALIDADFLTLLKQLRRRFPKEKAERMLASLDIETAREREVYYTAEEYAAALLGATPDSIRRALEN